MKKIGIVTDSHCGISPAEGEKIGVRVIPMPLFIDNECFYENVSITRDEFFEKIKSCDKLGTSQASPGEVTDVWNECLKEYETILYMPISSGLSGACATAKLLASEEEFEGRVFVVDNGRISTPMHRSILDAVELIEKGMSAAEIRDILEAEGDNMSIYIAVETLEYLKKGGRISGATAAIGTMLDIKPILRVSTGLLESHSKCRGSKKAKRMLIDEVKKDIETRFSDYSDDELHLLIASSADEETTAKWVEQVQEAFPGKEILCDYLSLGISCHTGGGALGIGISCKPGK